MKTWKKYIDYLLEGEWHIHTSYTDGKNSVFEYCEKAIEIGIPLLAFTEHVRKNLNYDFNSFLDEIEKTREEFDLIILSGCEAKVLPNGELDVEKWILNEADYPIFAFHSFPEDIDLYTKCLKSVLKNKYVNTWAHPGLFLRNKSLSLSDEEVEDIFDIASQRNVLIELNEKYNLPARGWIEIGKKKGINFVRGSDVHSVMDLK